MTDLMDRARRVGLTNVSGWTAKAFMEELLAREKEEYEFFSSVRTCQQCGRDSIPKVYGNAEEFIEVCQECRSVDSFPPEDASKAAGRWSKGGL